MIRFLYFHRAQGPLLDGFTLESGGGRSCGNKNTTKSGKCFSEQKPFPENICLFFHVPDFTLIPVKHDLKRRLVGFVQKALCCRGQFARYESVACGFSQPSWLSRAWAEPPMHSQGSSGGRLSSCARNVGTCSSEGPAGVASWPCLKEKSMCVCLPVWGVGTT